MKRAYYTGGVGELFLTGEEPVKLADLEEASLLLDYSLRPIGSERDDFPVAVIRGPGTGTVSCVVRGFLEGGPLTSQGQARAFTRAVRFTVPSEEPFRINLAEEAISESLVIETPEGDAFGRTEGIPTPGKASYRPAERAIYFSQEDAGREILLSYAYGETNSEPWRSREMGLILVFPALGRDPSGDPAFRVIEARRAVLSSFSEEFVSGRETLARASFVLLADEDGFLVRERTVEAGS